MEIWNTTRHTAKDQKTGMYLLWMRVSHMTIGQLSQHVFSRKGKQTNVMCSRNKKYPQSTHRGLHRPLQWNQCPKQAILFRSLCLVFQSPHQVVLNLVLTHLPVKSKLVNNKCDFLLLYIIYCMIYYCKPSKTQYFNIIKITVPIFTAKSISITTTNSNNH